MTETERSLLQGIRDDPDDDLVRLAYADFLEESGDPRGEFIRLQVMGARNGRDDASAEREKALADLYAEEWSRSAWPCDLEKVRLEFKRGFIEDARVESGTDEDLSFLRRLPGLQFLHLKMCKVSPAGLEHVASLENLRSFTFCDTKIDADGLAVLESLPCWTRVRCDDNYPDEAAWAEFQERRIGKFDDFDPSQRRRAALLYLSELTGQPPPFTAVRVNERLSDAEMRFFPERAELEEIDLRETNGLTTAGLRYLCGMPNLKSFTMHMGEAASIHPLMSCTTLETLRATSYLIQLEEESTEGLDQLTNLRDLQLASDRFGDATVARLRPLRHLRELSLQCGPLADEDCLEAISGLTNLKTLAINDRGDDPPGFRDGALRHFAALVRLRVLKLRLGPGSGDGLRHLTGLRELQFLQLSGAAVTDEGIRHLASLRNLRTLMAQPSSITESGAQWLAERLPAVTIITMEHIVKSPRASIIFRRVISDSWASALVPVHWIVHENGPFFNIEGHEDGWEDVGYLREPKVQFADIGFTAFKTKEPTTAEAFLRQRMMSPHPTFRAHERDPITWPGWETASCIYQKDHSQHLTCVAVHGCRYVVLDCDAPPSRFESFRPLFLFVARSVRLGDAAQKGVGEQIEVSTSEIERAAT